LSPKRVYIDSGILISAFRGSLNLSLKAIQILDDPTLEFASSHFVRLETLPKAVYNQQQIEQVFYEAFFANVSCWSSNLEQVLQTAERLAHTYGLAGMDALHIAAALSVDAEEFITTEKSTKPMHRVGEIRVVSIYD
jgi:predicted nucleic acid-binding protein